MKLSQFSLGCFFLLLISTQSCTSNRAVSPSIVSPHTQASANGVFSLEVPITAPAGSVWFNINTDGEKITEFTIQDAQFKALPFEIETNYQTFVATPDTALINLQDVDEITLEGIAEATIQVDQSQSQVPVALVYQGDTDEVTFEDFVLMLALRDLPASLRTADTIVTRANELFPAGNFTTAQLDPIPSESNTDFVEGGSFPAPDLLDATVVYAASFLPPPLRNATNIATIVNTLIPGVELEPAHIRAIPGIKVPNPTIPQIRRFIPIGSGYETDTLEQFAQEAIAYNTDATVEIRVLLAPFSFDSEVPIDPELNLQDGQNRANQVQAACEQLVTSPITCNTTLPDVQLRVDAENSDIVAQYDPNVVDGIYALGGDQEIAMQIVANTPLELAMQESYFRGAPFAGNSAGAAMQSRNMFLAFADDGVIPITLITAFTPQGLEFNSFQLFFEEDSSVRRGLIYGLDTAVVEQHTHQRGRLGRLLQATQRSPGPKLGLGVDAFTGSLIINETDLVETVGDTSTVIVDQETYGAAASATYVGPRQVLSIQNVALHLLPEGGYGYDLATLQPTFNGALGSSPPNISSRSFDFLTAPPTAGPLLLGGDQVIPSNPDFLEPTEDVARLVLQRFVELAGEQTVILAVGYEDDSTANQVASSFQQELSQLGLSNSQTAIVTEESDLVALANVLDSATAIFVTGDDQSLVANQIPQLETLDLKGLWEGGRVLFLDNAATAAAGTMMVSDPTPTNAYESGASRRQAEIESQATYLSGEVSFKPGLGLISGATFEPRAFFDYRYGRLLSSIFDGDPDSVAIGIERETAIEITQSGARVVGPDGVIVFDGRFASVLDIGANNSFAANWFILDTFATGDLLLPQ